MIKVWIFFHVIEVRNIITVNSYGYKLSEISFIENIVILKQITVSLTLFLVNMKPKSIIFLKIKFFLHLYHNTIAYIYTIFNHALPIKV